MNVNSSAPVVTRFAPSPTGFLHIGGARTAMFNWLFARHHGGKALLRIEDTDKVRSTQEAIDAILEGLDWLGLDWDDEPVFQSRRAERHAEVARELLASGNAYKCFATPEELAEMREQQRAEKKPMRYDGRWRDRDPSEAPEGAPFAIRLKTEQQGKVTIADAVQGDVSVQNSEIDDFILLRSDGTPTYMLAVVVDDHDMGVTHLVRGDDHLNNAFRQLALIRAMGWAEPVYAHIPLIHGNDGAKLSKRHGALGVEAYRDMGIMSDAMFNYLLRLGWGHGDDEIISRAQAIEWFDLAGVGKSPSRFDAKKLQNLNGQYIREADDSVLVALTRPLIGKLMERDLTDAEGELLTQAMPVLKSRAKNLNELAENSVFLYKKRPLGLDEKAQALLDADARHLLESIHSALAKLDDWTLEATEDCVKAIAEAAELGLGKLAQPMRAALTGSTSSPGIFDVLVLLGKQESLARLEDQTK
ncbi:glutamyl-tRNA synthetase [Parasphingorhabdus marina DSM 22363]|uniref:Glutamate--tRNA ligase n=1 Tax=Parasphingorhabdus marina DSM 22363 TaxID=1123272 RepID=A0A1N6FZJ2_9SPHN|nr:glutamate--tRNA ligase [Parasphingorhabdus marina]SIO00729.1 glutamyl-tRNA synthetase [Parasphingorhabdus marina DSM 22363]